jgi:hypothetical protein
MSNLTNSPAMREFLSHMGRIDTVEYSIAYIPDALSYQFVAQRMVNGDPYMYSAMITEESIEEFGAGQSFNHLRIRALQGFIKAGNVRKVN